jgi:hypothetical protein
MKVSILALLIVLTGTTWSYGQAASTGQAHSQDLANLVGVWQAELDGQPSAILTLAEDTGTLEGTLVLNGISREGGQPHIAVREAHVLMHPHIDGNTLSFQVKGIRGSNDLMDFTVTLSDSGSATLHCSNCGSDAPSVALTKET